MSKTHTALTGFSPQMGHNSLFSWSGLRTGGAFWEPLSVPVAGVVAGVADVVADADDVEGDLTDAGRAGSAGCCCC